VGFSLKKHEILRSKKNIKELFDNGSSFFIYPFKVYYLSGENQATNMVLFSVPKKHLKRAVDRNLVRRRLKEAYRLNKSMIKSGSDIPFSLSLTLIYIAESVINYTEIESKLIQVFVRLNKTAVKQ
jgi:ribonuclease P protein component